MKKVRNVSNETRAVSPPNGAAFTVAPGDDVEVSDELARSLLRQPRNWQAAPAPKKDKE